MSRGLMLVGFAPLAVVGGAVLAGQRQVGARPEEQPLDPMLRDLLNESARGDKEQESAFFSTLKALARKQHWSLDRLTEEGRAVPVRDDRNSQVVVILGGWDHTIPGYDWQHLLLLDQNGHLLDRLSCDINARLTWMAKGGVYRTDVPETPERDGAHLVIRYIPKKGSTISGNFEHHISHAGKRYSFPWNLGTPDAIPSGEWESKGLCRVAIRGGKFAV